MLTHVFRPVQVKRDFDTSGVTTSGNSEKRGHARSVGTLGGVLALLLSLLLGGMPPARAAPTQKLFQTCLMRDGGAHLVAGDVANIAKYDLAILNGFHYYDLGGNAWAQIRKLNPNILIYLYEMGSESASHQDAWPRVSLNNLGRYNVSRGHPMGSLNGNHPELFLLDASGNRIHNPGQGYTGYLLMDFGSPVYQAYWVEAVREDIVAQPWVADGVFVDGCGASKDPTPYTPPKYPNNATWGPAMNSFSQAIQKGMSKYGQRIFANRGGTSESSDGIAQWKLLDASATPPDAVFEEGAFAVGWGSKPIGSGYQVQFFSESAWKRQVDVMSLIHHSKVGYESQCSRLTETQSGVDNYGKPVGFWDIFWFSMCSYLLGKNIVENNSYWGFVESGNLTVRYGEYDSIDLGNATGTYKVTNVGGTNVYWREYRNGYVYVNPTGNDVASVALPKACKKLSHANFTLPLTGIPDVTSISLPAHRGVIVMIDSAASATAPAAP